MAVLGPDQPGDFSWATADWWEIEELRAGSTFSLEGHNRGGVPKVNGKGANLLENLKLFFALWGHVHGHGQVVVITRLRDNDDG